MNRDDSRSEEARRKANAQLSGKKGAAAKQKAPGEVEKTARLRALRLAKEAADAAEAAAAPPKPPAAKSKKAKPKTPAAASEA